MKPLLAQALMLTPDAPYRMATNRVITIAIITILVLLIFAVIFSKFR